MAEIALREALSADKPALRELIAQAALATYPALEALGRVSRRERLEAIQERLESDPGARVWVAADGGEAVGLVWLAPSHHPVTEQADWLVMALAVSPTHRGRGLGEALLRRAEAEAKKARVPRLRLFVHHGNAAALALYRRCGFAPETIEMSRDL